MQIRKFTAPDMRQALTAIKRELGPDAVVVATRRVPGPGLLSASQLEVTAAIDDPGAVAVSRPGATRESPSHVSALVDDAGDAALRDEVRELRRLLAGARGLQRTGDSTVEALMAGDVSPEIARRLASGGGLVAALTTHLDRTSYQAAPGPARIALVGPTGVGKTTTIAKLAADAALVRGLRVTLITLDTYRVGAIEQLRQFANLMRVPLEVARDASELERVVGAHRSADLVLVDTAGRNPGDERQVPMLAETLGRAEVAVHLTLAAATRRAELRASLNRYLPLAPTALLFTKLDEAVSLAALVNARGWCELPLSYVTFGQRVPEDIARADPNDLAERIVTTLLAAGPLPRPQTTEVHP